MLVSDFRLWKVFLHESQFYLGRCYIWAKREGLVDLMDARPDEREELFLVGHVMKTALSSLFQPNLFNWASLGNISSHCHLHLIPRYREPRNFAGLQFVDTRWGQNYAPYDRNFKVPKATLQKIKDVLEATVAMNL